jgi:hypothetical protein
MIKKIFRIFILLLITSPLTHANEELILNSDKAFSPTFLNRFSFLAGVNPSIRKASDITNFSFSYGKKIDDYWFDSNILVTNALFSKITTNNTNATGLGSDQINSTKSNLISVGAGYGRESHYIQSLLPFTDLYEMMAANLTYNIYNETASEKTFSGLGMLAKFSLYKKVSDYMSLGTQFSYNLSALKRASDSESETSSNRSLTLSYLTVGFELNFYL